MNEALFFHLTGRRTGSALAPVDGLALRPALFARFRDLTRLRYDFPVVLLGPDDEPPLRPLSRVVDGILDVIGTKGPSGERLERNVLRLEREIRAVLAEGESGSLSEIWRRAAERLVAKGDELVAADLARARKELRTDGVLVDHDAMITSRVIGHVRGVAHVRKARKMRSLVEPLVVRLSELVRADLLRSPAGRGAEALRAAIGPPHRELFDLDAMERVLARPSATSAMPEARRRRIEATLNDLRSERLFDADADAFTFGSVDAALAAFRERQRAMSELMRAIATAELEVRGSYVAVRDDARLAPSDARALAPEDMSLFPDHLVRLGPSRAASARAQILEALTSGLPIKVLVETDDVFGPDAQLAATAMGLADVFVVQVASSGLASAAATLVRAFEFPGPALISVFSGAVRTDLPSYLVAAAATESRAFPAFSYDPSAGPDWAHRFALADAPQRARTWPVHELTYADDAMQRVRLDVPFTLADLAVCDPRRSDDLAIVPRERWDGPIAPLIDRLDGSGRAAHDATPFVLAVDADDRLVRVLVGDRLLDATRRSADAWRRLLELDDLTHDRLAVSDGAAPEAAGAVAQAEPAPAPATEDGERSPDEPYIETARCSSCNECTLINARMFTYDANKQAYIADASAGTYRELVEAAESCQVGVIHPGKPRDPNEPGLDELIERAQALL